MTNKQPSSVEHNEELHCGLTTQEIHEGLSGLQNGNFPMRLLTKWYVSEKKNGYKDWLDVSEQKYYKPLVQSERNLIKQLPKVVPIEQIHRLRNDYGEKSEHVIRLIKEGKYMGYISNVTDIGCGDGKTLQHLINHLFTDSPLQKVSLLDSSGLALQNASQRFPKTPKETILADVFDPLISLYTDRDTLTTSTGRGYGNMSNDERKALRNKVGDEGKLLLSVFKTPQTEAAKKNRLKAYGADPDGDNAKGRAACKAQLWDMLSVLGFTAQQLESCKFTVQYGEVKPDGSTPLLSGFVPNADITIYKGEDEYIYPKNIMLPMYHSDSFELPSLNYIKKHYGSGHDKIYSTYENDESLIVIIQLEKGRYTYIRRRAKLALATALLLIGGQKLAKMTYNYALNSPVISEGQKNNLDDVLLSNGTYDEKQHAHYQSLLNKTVDLYYAAYNGGGNSNFDLRGIDPISKNDRDNYLVPAITNILATLPSCESNGIPCDTMSEHDIYTIALQVAEKNPALFHGGVIEKPNSRLMNAYDTHNEDYTRLASQEIKEYIYNMTKDIPLENYNTILEELDKKFSDVSRYRTYSKSGNVAYFAAIHTPYDLNIGTGTPAQIVKGEFLLFIPGQGDIKKYKTWNDILAFSQMEATRMSEFKYSFDRIVSGANTGF